MKKQNIIIGAIAVIVIIIIAVLIGRHGGSMSPAGGNTSVSTTSGTGSNQNQQSTAAPIPVTQVASSSNGVTLYTNNELGFSVDYPTSWKVEGDPSGPSFTIPLTIAGKDPSTQNTIATLAASIYITSGACTFPTLGASATTKVSTTTVGSNSFGTLSVQNSTSALNYTDMMYTLQQGSGKDSVCYVFAFGAIAKKTTNGADQTNNGTVISEATQEFTTMVKSFKFVTGPAGQSESSHPAGK